MVIVLISVVIIVQIAVVVIVLVFVVIIVLMSMCLGMVAEEAGKLSWKNFRNYMVSLARKPNVIIPAICRYSYSPTRFVTEASRRASVARAR